MSKFKIGDRVWNIGNELVELEEVEIVSKPKESNGILYYNTKGITIEWTWNFRSAERDLFSSKEEALAEIRRRNEKEIEYISSKVNSTKDLLQMMLGCMHDEMRTDCNYIEVAKHKAKELLGIEL